MVKPISQFMRRLPANGLSGCRPAGTTPPQSPWADRVASRSRAILMATARLIRPCSTSLPAYGKYCIPAGAMPWSMGISAIPHSAPVRPISTTTARQTPLCSGSSQRSWVNWGTCSPFCQPAPIPPMIGRLAHPASPYRRITMVTPRPIRHCSTPRPASGVFGLPP